MSLAAGVLVVDKRPGATSFDAVSLVRKQLGIRRVGHAGTLDPAATGVLPILVGEATKLMPYLMDQDKEYLATIRFGLTTDTHDAGGRILAENPVPRLERSELEETCRRFVGRIKQVPPMYSAVHHEGQRLYALARRGLEVDREPREVVVHAIEIQDLAPPRATLRVVCGKGTYVRALAADLGAALGYGGVVEGLARVRVGPFHLNEAVTWPDLAGSTRAGLCSRVKPPEAALVDWPRVDLDEGGATAFTHGQAVDIVPIALERERYVRVHGNAGALIGVGVLAAGGRRVRPVRILHADRPGTRALPA